MRQDADHDYQTDEDYSYDDNGNRTDYTMGDHNRVSSDGTKNYRFDGEGNLIRQTVIATDEVTVYRWDHRNRLVEVVEYASTSDADAETNATKRVTQVYDAHDRWIGRYVDSDGDGTGITATNDTWFVYDGNQIVFQFEGSNGDGENADLTNRYLWGPNRDQLLASEEVASLSTAGDVLWPLTDNLGTVRDLAEYDDTTDTTSVAANLHFTYDAFGNITAGDVSDLRFTYTAQEWDGVSELYYYNNRWYDAVTGQFTTPDPIEHDRENPYRAMRNSPTNYVDPSGLEEAGAEAVRELAQMNATIAELTESGNWNWGSLTAEQMGRLRRDGHAVSGAGKGVHGRTIVEVGTRKYEYRVSNWRKLARGGVGNKPTYALSGDYPATVSNPAINQIHEINSRRRTFAMAEIGMSILPGGSTATYLANYMENGNESELGWAALAFAQDVAETITVVGKVQKAGHAVKMMNSIKKIENAVGGAREIKAAHAALALTSVEGISAIANAHGAYQDYADGNTQAASLSNYLKTSLVSFLP